MAVQTVAFCAPVGLCVAVRRTRARDVATCCLQMWAYVAAYKFPHDDPDEQARRVHVDYPIAIDRVLGLGELPTVRLQRALARSGPDGPQWRVLDRVLAWAHWSWFMVPHGALAYVLLRHPRRFDRAAAMTYAVFDLGAAFYWVAPTAPPWYAAAAPENGAARPAVSPDAVGSGAALSERGSARPAEDPGTARSGAAAPENGSASAGDGGPVTTRGQIEARRMMVEYGEFFWGDGWEPLYSVLGGNPLAAMPSLHFATSVMAALLLAETGPVAGALGWAYAGTLGFALVYLGEHYLVDLLAGAALTAAVRGLAPRVGPALGCGGRAVAALEARAHGEG